MSTYEHPDKEWCANGRHHEPYREFIRKEEVACHEVAEYHQAGTPHTTDNKPLDKAAMQYHTYEVGYDESYKAQKTC